MPPSPAAKYVERYSHGVILRDNDLSTYNKFLHNAGEHHTLLEIVRTILQRKKHCRILDVGCGNANAMHELKQHAGAGVHTAGIDLLPLSHPRNVDEFVQGDAHTVPFPSENDLILSFRALHEMGNLETLLPRFAHALAPGGRAYLWVRTRDPSPHGSEWVGEMNAHEEKTLLELEKKGHLNECKCLVTPIRIENPTPRGNMPFVGGYVVLLHRPV